MGDDAVIEDWLAGATVLTSKKIVDGFQYLEAARWHDNALWFSDIGQKSVFRLSEDNKPEFVVEVPERPSGLGWDANGDLLLVSMEDQVLKRFSKGVLSVVRPLSDVAMHPNDMTVDATGRSYITQFGYDLFGGAPAESTSIVRVSPNGSVDNFGSGLVFPNGIDISADGKTLVVAESFAARLSAFDVLENGDLANQRVLIDFGEPGVNVPDGLCIDAEGGVWVGSPFRGEFWRVSSEGKVTHRVHPEGPGNYCVDAMLGGDDMKTLFLLVADTDVERLGNNWDSTASIQTLRVDVAGA